MVPTRAAQLAPELVARAVYLCAFMPGSGIPAIAYIQMPENDGELVGGLFRADPAVVGALRLDLASNDPAYRQRLREAFFGDVDPALADAVLGLVTPDAPVGILLGATTLTGEGWGSVPRTLHQLRTGHGAASGAAHPSISRKVEARRYSR